MIKKKIITICIVSCVLVIFSFSFGGCGKQDEQVSPEPSNVKSFKIDKVEKKSNESGSDAKGVGQIEDKPADAGAPAVKTEAAEPGPGTPSDMAGPVAPSSEPVATNDESVGKEDQVTDLPDQTSPEAEKSSPEKDAGGLALSPAYAAIDSEDAGKGLIYNPEGKIDPFEPLFRSRQEKEVAVTGKAQTIRSTRIGKLTPLEKMDISQLKLTAIIISQQKNIAMVRESTGKGHVVSKGTYIGINSGRVVEITKNTVIIEEEVEDLLGKIIVRKRELKLQKPLGEM